MRTATIKPFLFLSVVIVLASCQKEVNYVNNNSGNGNSGSDNTSNIQGDYDFVGLVAHTQSTVSADQGGSILKSVTVSDYATQTNSGTVTINASQFIGNGLAYTIDTVMNVKTYQDNVLLDDSNYPFSTTVPPNSSTSPYVRNSSDSITVTGFLGVSTDPSGNAPTGPVGIKLAWSGDTLLLKINSAFSQSVSQGGVPATIVGSVTGTMKLKKH